MRVGMVIAGSLLGAGCAPEPVIARPPFVLVSLDTLRADRLGAYGSTAGLTPNLDHFAREAVVFENAFTQASETLFSHAAMFTSRYPSELDRLDYSFRQPDDTPSLPWVLRLYGYRTGAVTGGGHMGRGFGFERGFENYEVPAEWGSMFHTGPMGLAWLDQAGIAAGTDPFFLFVHSYDTHARYLKPSPYGHLEAGAKPWPATGEMAVIENNGTTLLIDGRYYTGRVESQILDLSNIRPRSPEERARLRAAPLNAQAGAMATSEEDLEHARAVYDGAVRYVDTLFGLFMVELSNRGLLDKAVVVVMSDHGEELGEEGLFNHRMALSEAVMRVPLMMRLPQGVGGGRRVEGQVGLIDVMPTLLEAAGAEIPAGVQGQSLWGGLLGGAMPSHDVIFAEGIFRMVSAHRGDDHLVFSGIAADSPWLPTLLRTARIDGPAFTGSEHSTRSQRAALRQEMVTWRSTLGAGRDGENELSDEQRATLQERGYWEPQ